MRFLKEAKENYKIWEIGLIILALAIIFTSSYLIYSFNFEKTEKIDTNYLAKIVRLYGNVKYKSTTQSYYELAKLDNLISSGGEIFTELNSEAIVKVLNNNVVIELRPLSLIKILEEKDEQVVELIDGVVNFEVSKGKEVWIKSNNEKLKLKAEKDNLVTAAYLSDGKIVVTSDELNQKKNADFEILTPIAGEKVEADENIKIKLNQSGNYKVQLSKEPNFKTILASAEIDGSELNWSLPIEEGLFYLRVFQGNSSRIVPLYVESKFKMSGVRPKDGETISLFPGGKFVISWNPAGAESYRITIKDSFDHEETLYTTRNEIEVANVKGEFLEILISPEVEPNKYSNIKRIIKLGLNFTGAILLKQDQLQNVYLENTKAKTISWEGKDSELYRVRIIDTDKDLEVGVKNISTNSLELPKLNIGSYKLEISSINYPTMRKAVYTFDIKTPIVTWDLNLSSKIETENPNEKIKLIFSFNTKDDLNPFTEMKYYSDDGVNMVEKKTPLDESYTVDALGFGKYCIVIKPEVYSKNITASEENCFILKRKSKFSDLDQIKQEQVKKAKGKRAIFLVELPKIKKAVRYIVETYKEKGQEKLLFDSNTNIVEVEIKNLEQVFMRYKVLDKDSNESNFSPMSKINLK